MTVFLPNDVSSKDILPMWNLRGNLHTQTAMFNVRLTFMVVWVEMPDIRVATEMTKTIISKP